MLYNPTMLKIEKLSSKNAEEISNLIYEFQKDHLNKYGVYYALIPYADKKIKDIILKSIHKRNMAVYIAYFNTHPAGYIFLQIDTRAPIYEISKIWLH